ncbi:hypothetical protein BDQ94DRAFT_42397 [Aspergillus welwitschiae]|uniref:Uncharacterized protein n=1 Tax=Aspergillus welwitschiae TaxID=1341132 RepID=A0A3F3Q016_9EURO|nr:hypothetical protein BDQ94DRAFT_42397 [Aspergillus welwitschiae]RDH32471.1 hypothetical protein BDQ94DRAFT_42397 [Aspergillus welwitschiae]
MKGYNWCPCWLHPLQVVLAVECMLLMQPPIKALEYRKPSSSNFFPSVSVEVQMSAWLGYLVIIAIPFCHRILLSPCHMQDSRQFARLKGLWRH